MIILNLNKINSYVKSFSEILKIYTEMLNFGVLVCPHCNSNNLIRWGFYFRNIFYIDNGIMHFELLKIQRFKCNDCGHTHALLPSFIVPYKQSCLDVILESIKGNNISYEFSLETVDNWKYSFRKFVPYFTGVLKISKNLLNDILDNIFYIYDKFYIINKLLLMMTHYGVFNMAYF